MGLTVFTSAQSKSIRKQYYLDKGAVKARFNPGAVFSTVERMDMARPHDLLSIYSRSEEENLALVFGKPSTKTFERNTNTVLSEVTTDLVLDIEWLRVSVSPSLDAGPEQHLDFILRNLGFNQPESLAAFIAPSASCGIENFSKPQTYRWHVWLKLDKAYPQDKVKEALEKTLPSPYVDSSPLRQAQIIAIQEGVYPSEVKRHKFKQKYFAREGREVSLTELKSVRPLPQLAKELRAEEILEEDRNLKAALAKATNMLGKTPEFDSTFSLKHELEKLAYEPKKASEPNGESKLDGNRNLLLYLYIRAVIVLEGTAEHFIDWILSDKSIAGDWTLSQLESKAKRAFKSLSLAESLGGIKAHFNPHKVVSLAEKDLSLMTDISEIPTKGKVLLCTGEGTGKTSLMFGKWLKRFEQDWEKERIALGHERPPRILYVCFRRAVLKQVSLEYGLDNYEEIGKDDEAGAKLSPKQRKEAFCSQSNKLAICNRSLLTLKPSNRYPAPYDVVFIDEIEACLDDIYLELRLADGDEEPWIEREKQFSLLKRICREAGCVIGADASATGLMSGWFMDLISEEEREEKTLIENSEDYIANKEIRLHKYKEGLIQEISKSYHAGEVCSVHTGFGNNENQGMETLKRVLVKLGVPEEAIGLYYPKALDDWEKEQVERGGVDTATYRSNPDLVIAQELERGIKIFINSPALGVGWSVKTERITRIFGVYSSTIFSARWIKQFIRRVRKAPRIDLFITPQKSEPPSAETEGLLNEVLLDDYPKEEFSHLKMRGDLKQLMEKQAIRTSFIKLIESCGGSWDWSASISEVERKQIREIEKDCSESAVKSYLKEFENMAHIVENFRLLSGEEIEVGQFNEEAILKAAIGWERSYGAELKPLLMLWDDYRQVELINNKELQKIFALKVLVLHEIDLMFKGINQEQSFHDWYLDPRKEEVTFFWENTNHTQSLSRLVDEYGFDLQRLFFKSKEVKQVTARTLLNEVAKALFLDFKNIPQATYKSFNTDATTVRNALKKSYGIPKAVRVGETKDLLFDYLNKKESRFTRNEEIFLACNTKRACLKKRLFMPRVVSVRLNELTALDDGRLLNPELRKNSCLLIDLLDPARKNKEFNQRAV